MRCRLLILPLFASATPTLAQEPEQVIIVTGQGLAAARGDAAYDVAAIRRDRLASSPSNRLEDVLRDVPGFQQFRRSDARSANPTSQGATLRALGGNASSRVLVLLDGVPQSDPFGGWIAWAAIDPRRLSEARVIRGGGTGAGGPGALAGTIELTSARPADSAGTSGRIAYGSRDSIDAFAGLGAPLGAGFASLAASWSSGDGFIPVIAAQRGPVDRPSPYAQGSLALRTVFPVAATIELQTNLSAFTDSRERGTAMSDIDSKGADASLRLVGSGRLPFAALAYVQVRDFRNLFVSVNADRTAVSQTLDQVSVPATGAGTRIELRPLTGRTELRLGADWRGAEGRTQELFQFVAGAPTRGRIAGGRTDTFGSFAELSVERGRFTLTAGARIDRWRIADGTLRERTLATGAVLTDSVFPGRSGWEPTGRAGLAWRVAPGLALRAAAYRGWRLPTLNELYRPFRVGTDATAANAALAPERLEGVEGGVELRPAAGVRLGATLFASRLEQAIGNVTLGAGPGVFPGVGFVAAGGQFRQRLNLDAIDSRGVELDGEIAVGRWRLAAGYSLADARVDASGPAAALDGLRPAQTPRHSFSLGLSWHARGGASAALTARYAGSQFEDDLNRQRVPDALTLDAVAALPLTRRLAIEARGENLSDARVVAGISGAGIVERATPRTLWLGLRWRG